MKNMVVDAMGEACPIPVVKATQALREMKEPGTLQVHVDNEIAVQNLTRLAGKYQLSASAAKQGEGHFVVSMQVETPVAGQAEKAPAPACAPDVRGNFVVAVESRTMGRGDDKLGETLMKGFLFAVAACRSCQGPSVLQQRRVPDDGGLRSLEDLRNMEAQGVEIMTCGTCLNYSASPNSWRWASRQHVFHRGDPGRSVQGDQTVIAPPGAGFQRMYEGAVSECGRFETAHLSWGSSEPEQPSAAFLWDALWIDACAFQPYNEKRRSAREETCIL
jgi:selenium metabolism protein YedF